MEDKDAKSIFKECNIYISSDYDSLNIENDNLIKLCNEKNHNTQFEYFCKDHNQLCCGACIAKVGTKYSGKHNNCNVCIIGDIKDEKKKNFLNNVIILLKLLKIFEDINNNKNKLTFEIKNIFLKIREIINDKEEKISEKEKQFEQLTFKKDILIESEQLTDKIKSVFEKSKKIKKESHDDHTLLNCIDIEEVIKQIDIEKCKILKKGIIKLVKDINNFFDDLKSFLSDYIKKKEMNKNKAVLLQPF